MVMTTAHHTQINQAMIFQLTVLVSTCSLTKRMKTSQRFWVEGCKKLRRAMELMADLELQKLSSWCWCCCCCFASKWDESAHDKALISPCRMSLTNDDTESLSSANTWNVCGGNWKRRTKSINDSGRIIFSFTWQDRNNSEILLANNSLYISWQSEICWPSDGNA